MDKKKGKKQNDVLHLPGLFYRAWDNTPAARHARGVSLIRCFFFYSLFFRLLLLLIAPAPFFCFVFFIFFFSLPFRHVSDLSIGGGNQTHRCLETLGFSSRWLLGLCISLVHMQIIKGVNRPSNPTPLRINVSPFFFLLNSFIVDFKMAFLCSIWIFACLLAINVKRLMCQGIPSWNPIVWFNFCGRFGVGWFTAFYDWKKI